jgi:universal stress protein A
MLENIQRILVPVGFDAFSEEELRTADNIATRHQAEIHAFHAYQDVFKILSMRTLDLNKSQIEKIVHEEVDEDLKAILSSLNLRSNVVEVIRKGDTAEQLLEYANEAAIDLIIIGTHGRAGLEHFFMGSVTEKIVRYSPCPVLTLRPD